MEIDIAQGSNLHIPVGKKSFDSDKLVDNLEVLIMEIMRAKPSSSKGRYIKSMSLSPTMGPSVKLDSTAVVNALH